MSSGQGRVLGKSAAQRVWEGGLKPRAIPVAENRLSVAENRGSSSGDAHDNDCLRFEPGL